MTSPMTIADDAVKVPLLREGAHSKNYELVFVGTSYLAEISVSPAADFFLVQGDHFWVFDAAGRQRFALKRRPDTHRPPMTHYVATNEGIFDLSEPEPTLHAFAASINDEPSRTLTRDSWQDIFSQLYHQADVVVYGKEPDFDLVRFPAWLRVDGQWLVIYIPYHVDVRDDFDLGSEIDGFPTKFDRMTYLKSPDTGVLAADNRRLRGSRGLLPEDDLAYYQPGTLEWVSFDRETVLDSSYYLGIPLSFTGPAVHQLTIRGETMRFRENAVKPLLGSRESNLHWYALPESLAGGSAVSFIEFAPTSNLSSRGSDGIYILRPRTEALSPQ